MRYDIGTLVCQRYTTGWLAAALALGFAASGYGQTADSQAAWRKLGGTTVDLGLASAATGPVAAVWFSSDGATLYARTRSGKIFESSDLETWKPAEGLPVRIDPVSASPARVPESGAAIRTARDGRLYALGSNLYASSDSGRTWINLTGYNGQSVIGGGERDLAVSPRDSQVIFVANDFGIWRSNDGGLSWSGLNDGLPNLPAAEIVNPVAGRDAGLFISGMGAAQLDTRGPVASASWRISSTNPPGKADRDSASKTLGATISALNGSGDVWYAGSMDGRLWASRDGRATWTPAAVNIAGAIERIFVDSETPSLAIVAAAAKGPHLFRTINAGQTWDDITNNLADAPAHGVAADRASGAVYVAADTGIFMSRMDLNALGPASPWTPVANQLPKARAMDVKLDAAGSQLMAALEGYGVYTAPAPHRSGTVKLVNAADMSQRAAAPGSLYSVVGAEVQAARGAGLNFPILAAGKGSSQIQVPFEVTGSQVSLSLERAGGPLVVGLPLKPVSPAIFLNPDGAPMLVDADTGLVLDAGTPVSPRARIQVLATGLGRVKPDWPSGMPAPAQNPPAVAADVQAFLNGVPLEVTRATLAPGYIGLYVVEIQIPAILDSGNAEFYLTAGGQESNRVRVEVDALAQ